MTIKALIAVRSGSVRVKNKNIRPFSGSSLLEIKIQQLLKVGNLDGIIVNSNDDAILKIASRFGVELVKREEQFAANDVPMSDVYRNMAENANSDIILYANVTNPLVPPERYDELIEFFLRGGDFDSLNSSSQVKEFMFLNGKPINYDLRNQPRSQDLPNIQALNFAISIISRKLMISQKNVVGTKPYLYDLPEIESIDIDTMLDFEIAEILYTRYVLGSEKLSK